MTQQKLHHAKTELEHSVETADDDDVRDTLRETAAAFSELATDDREADHAVMDSHLNTLRQASERVDGETKSHVDRALEHAEEYRTGLEQA